MFCQLSVDSYSCSGRYRHYGVNLEMAGSYSRIQCCVHRRVSLRFHHSIPESPTTHEWQQRQEGAGLLASTGTGCWCSFSLIPQQYPFPLCFTSCYESQDQCRYTDNSLTLCKTISMLAKCSPSTQLWCTLSAESWCSLLGQTASIWWSEQDSFPGTPMSLGVSHPIKYYL